MKRSEMIDILIEAGPMGMDERIADKMLSAIEKAGMLPPENGKEASYILDYRFKCLKWDEE